MPMVSLVICTYQRPNEIQQLLKTVAVQTVPPDEIIVVDGSLDTKTEIVICRSPEIIQNRLIYFHVQENERGLTRQRNVGIKHAKGDIIAFLDDDTVPRNEYFEEILACFQRHPDAVGVGGLITNETNWMPADKKKGNSLGTFRWGEWERRDDFRWRLRKLLFLDSPLAPGWMPPFGHGRPSNYPPDGNDYQVEFVMGGASAWRRTIFDTCRFSIYFDGYGLYEDLDFCIRASRNGSIYLCTRAQLEHHHAPGGRPNLFRYGKMVIRNGWYVWRQRWPYPPFIVKVKWWLVTLLLVFLRLIDFRNAGYQEAMGRFWGMLTLWFDKPERT
jgi:GT2 family glycosyltransferase